jgi:hypothetical protein
MTRPLTALLLALLTACTAGCGSETPTFSVGNVTVRDEIDLVKAASGATPPEDWDGSPVAVSSGGLTSVVVTWFGGDCVDSWTMTVSGFAIVIDLQPGPSRSDCGRGNGPAPVHAVMLELNRAVDASNIVVNLAEEAPAS